MASFEYMDASYLASQRAWLVARRVSKMAILRAGGIRAAGHSMRDITRINFAIKRIDTGQYGLCCNCGTLIGKDRLAIIPETPFCITCVQQVVERDS